jgi:hypothetical protein
MNTDTQRDTSSILAKGYYRHSQTLGEGGWSFLYKHGVTEWNKYILSDMETQDSIETITAQNDEKAVSAFRELYRLDEITFEIIKVVTDYQTIATSPN